MGTACLIRAKLRPSKPGAFILLPWRTPDSSRIWRLGRARKETRQASRAQQSKAKQSPAGQSKVGPDEADQNKTRRIRPGRIDMLTPLLNYLPASLPQPFNPAGLSASKMTRGRFMQGQNNAQKKYAVVSGRSWAVETPGEHRRELLGPGSRKAKQRRREGRKRGTVLGTMSGCHARHFILLLR